MPKNHNFSELTVTGRQHWKEYFVGNLGNQRLMEKEIPKALGLRFTDSINLSLVVPYSHKLSSAASCSSDSELSGWWRHRCAEVLPISFLDCCLLLPLVTTLLLARRDNATSTASCLCIAPLFPSFVLVLLIYISFKLLIYSFSSFVYSFRLIIF